MKRTLGMTVMFLAVAWIVSEREACGAEETSSGAELYYQETLKLFDETQKNLTNISRIAEIAAKLYVENTNLLGIAVDGETALMAEFQSRAGGLSTAVGWWPLERNQWKGLAFYFLRAGMAKEDAERIKIYNERGYPTFLFGTAQMLAEVCALNVQCVEKVVIPTAPHNGVIKTADGKWIVPTYETGTLCTVWPFFGEFIGACTRFGRMPPTFLSVMAPGGTERYEKLKNVKWFADIGEADPKVQPVPAGQLGREWIEITRGWLAKMRDTRMPEIRKAAVQGAKALKDGHRAFAILTGHCTAALPGVAQDAGYFKTIPATWAIQHQTPDKVPEKFPLLTGDFLYVDGYTGIHNDKSNYNIVDHARSQGAICAFAFAGYNVKAVNAVRPEEVYIDTQWELGDVVATVPGYDIKVLPASGLLTTALYEMINAEMAGILSSAEIPGR